MTEPFLSRWSRKKQAAKTEETPAPAPDATPPDPEEPPPPSELPVPELPAIESLDASSDYSAFLKQGVPPDLRQQALQRLWASDPGLMAPEVMDLHMGDYTSPVVAEVVKTAWRLGKGVLDAAELAEEEKQAAQAATAPQQPDDV
ncbi:hypothetical protein A6A04_08205 [Paramagnetospirillum marisnigri]|uniref:DUF3306 domain-containing protein n=1 Tax=Paramagnetospirillum marisnigri TaxID=1285242 RepID=A0A178M7Q4_9PROT|nr:DUF3306 domain-containing protein [Paramagnetospirillum marisnigri]OAN44790.1 hypothetical protein A6A04_08205 [Paramagnetospirillum marisnigri]